MEFIYEYKIPETDEPDHKWTEIIEARDAESAMDCISNYKMKRQVISIKPYNRVGKVGV